ncbi:MAG: 4Fe-4S binding protein, partial [Deltaproteobacteria bacterium]|nr:4Fe-4S binding protein [Deltaproteobacteria bacterium]
MKVIRKVIEIDEELCDGCGQCVPACAEGALQIVDGKAKIVADKYCDGLGACVGDCPTGALKVVERESDEFDEIAVETYLAKKEESISEKESILPCGCPTAAARTWEIKGEKPSIEAPSLLSHWPVKLNLVSPGVPCFDRDELVMAAD